MLRYTDFKKITKVVRFKELRTIRRYQQDCWQQYFLISLFIFSIISCDDKLTQSDCERITDEDACVERGCVYESGFEMTIGCGDLCHFTTESTGFSGCFLSDNKVQQEVWVTYHRPVADQFKIIILRHHIGNLTGWKNGSPACVTCSADLWVENP